MHSHQQKFGNRLEVRKDLNKVRVKKWMRYQIPDQSWYVVRHGLLSLFLIVPIKGKGNTLISYIQLQIDHGFGNG